MFGTACMRRPLYDRGHTRGKRKHHAPPRYMPPGITCYAFRKQHRATGSKIASSPSHSEALLHGDDALHFEARSDFGVARDMNNTTDDKTIITELRAGALHDRDKPLKLAMPT